MKNENSFFLTTTSIFLILSVVLQSNNSIKCVLFFLSNNVVWLLFQIIIIILTSNFIALNHQQQTLSVILYTILKSVCSVQFSSFLHSLPFLNNSFFHFSFFLFLSHVSLSFSCPHIVWKSNCKNWTEFSRQQKDRRQASQFERCVSLSTAHLTQRRN